MKIETGFGASSLGIYMGISNFILPNNRQSRNKDGGFRGSRLDLCRALLHEHYTVGLGLEASHGFSCPADDTLRVLESAGNLTCRWE